MYFNFETILTAVVILLGIILLLDKCLWAKKRLASGEKESFWIENARSFFPMLLIVLFIRSFLFEPFRIPSGSLKPTLLVGDFILTSKFSYGIRLPVLHTQIWEMSTPKRGDIVVFRWPPDRKIDYIKRIIGLPGDQISYIDKVLYLNGKPMSQVIQGYQIEDSGTTPDPTWQVIKKRENLNGIQHEIYQRPDAASKDFYDLVVPPGQYFVMGDNRDDSADSRYWGFVPDSDLVGKAIYIWFSWDTIKHKIRWNRIGMKIT